GWTSTLKGMVCAVGALQSPQPILSTACAVSPKTLRSNLSSGYSRRRLQELRRQQSVPRHAGQMDGALEVVAVIDSRTDRALARLLPPRGCRRLRSTSVH